MGEEPRPQDEMRPITALFADIVGSTGLGERLGPDEVKALVGECVTRMSRAVEDFGGGDPGVHGRRDLRVLRRARAS